MADVQRALAVAMADEVTQDWYDRELALALEAGDYDRMQLVAETGARQGLVPSPEQAAGIEALTAKATGTWATIRDCGVCIADIADCPSLTLLGTCALPVELTPVGDLNALRRAGLAAMEGEEIDRIEVSLAIAGLGATAAILASGGSSVTVKAGATALRLGRRLGTLTPAFTRELARLAEIGLSPRRLWAWTRGTAPLDEVVDTVRLAALGEVAADFSRVVRNTSLTDTVILMRHVDSAEDAGRLARLSDAAGTETRPALEVLGKSRAFRTLVRLSHLALSAGALLWLLAAQILAFAGERIGRMLIRGVRLLLRPFQDDRLST